jgi:subfamily B ATP-binding cassette protein MsbA
VAAIVGPSGTGKTTIASLIPRFFDPQSGHVRIDGMDVRSFTLKSLRDQISFVLQDTLLFRGTIWENIAYGRPDAPPEDTIRAAELANAHDFIVNMPHGYGTLVGERGVTLSGGQRRRIAIARAIVRNTPILILDEPTAGLDSQSSTLVLEALRRLIVGRTTLMITHQMQTVQEADRIVVLDGGRICEEGTHAALLAGGGLYSRLLKLHAGTLTA